MTDIERLRKALNVLERTVNRAILRLDWDDVTRRERRKRILELDIAAAHARSVLTTTPGAEHVIDMAWADCWCGPYQDPQEPKVIIHHREATPSETTQ